MNHFQQTVPLPAPVQDRQIQVTYHQGAIVVTLPKAKGFWSNWRTPKPAANLQDWTWVDELKLQGQRLGQSWRRVKGWLGHRLREWGDRLLLER
ncbi:MAG TPA: hypothetical protein IGR64_13120 [Leptolyngbyaceae cyanobacterium M65_K2018_010]|nr:hypothetical protein [Leptolyngbyaceae cyanobacterium M65_K2018_010]